MTLWKHYPDYSQGMFDVQNHPSFGLALKCLEFVNVAKGLAERSAISWVAGIKNWNTLVESGRRLFGDQWAFFSTR
jgi:hypothetical protein